VPIIPDPKPFNNQTIKELPPTVQSSDPKSDLVHNSPNVFRPSLQPSIYSYEFCRNDAYYGQDCSLQFPVIHQPPQEMSIQEMEGLKQQTMILQSPSLSTEEPDNSLSVGDEHLDAILATESDEFIKSSVENLVPIPSESEGESKCDVPIDYVFDEFDDELTLLKSIPSGIGVTDCYLEEEAHFIKRLLYNNSSLRPPEEFVFANSDTEIESFSPSPILG
nr:hypothetical protein [Tanacetum cinerariifolium]